MTDVIITPNPDGRSAELSGRLGPDIYELSRELPGRKRWQGRALLFELSRANVDMVREKLPLAVWKDPKRLEDILQLEQVEADARAAKGRPPPAEASAFRYKTAPREHQRQAFLLARDRGAFGFFLEQGLGKTKVVLDEAAYLYANGAVDTLLVIAPNGVHAQWLEEQAPEHLPDWVPRKGFVYRSNWTQARRKQCEELFTYHEGLRIFCVHQDALAVASGISFVERVLFSSEKVMWVIDESLCIKTPGAKRTKTALKLRDRAPVRRILTGTPVGKGVEDLYTQLRFLSDDVHGFTSFYTFRNRYCVTQPVPGAPAGAVKIVGYKNLQELKERMDAWTVRFTAADCLDLPERIYQERRVEMTEEQARMYAQLKEELLTQLDSGEIATADLAVVRLLRLQQILSGHIKDENGLLLPVKTLRPAAVMEIAEQTGPKLLVWARFHHDIELLRATFKHWNPVVWYGPTSQDDRKAAKERFINDPECGPFIANPTSAGIGLDGLQKVCHTMCYYNNDFSATTRAQSEARLYRDGQRGTVNVIDLVVPNSIDGYILRAHKRKKDIAAEALSLRRDDI